MFDPWNGTMHLRLRREENGSRSINHPHVCVRMKKRCFVVLVRSMNIFLKTCRYFGFVVFYVILKGFVMFEPWNGTMHLQLIGNRTARDR
jgi:CTP-dependent riboflavin kinase